MTPQLLDSAASAGTQAQPAADILDSASAPMRTPVRRPRRHLVAAVALAAALVGAAAWQAVPSPTEAPGVTQVGGGSATARSLAPAAPISEYAGWYGVLDAEGWSADPAQPAEADEKAWYEQSGGPGTVSLNWRSADSREPAWTDPEELGGLVGKTTLDGGLGLVYGEDGYVVVVGEVQAGRFLTMTVSGVPVDEAAELATHVHRQ